MAVDYSKENLSYLVGIATQDSEAQAEVNRRLREGQTTLGQIAIIRQFGGGGGSIYQQTAPQTATPVQPTQPVQPAVQTQPPQPPPVPTVAQAIQQQPTQPARKEVVGFPQSSDEYEKWQAMGRTFENGKWLEPSQAQPIVQPQQNQQNLQQQAQNIQQQIAIKQQQLNLATQAGYGVGTGKQIPGLPETPITPNIPPPAVLPPELPPPTAGDTLNNYFTSLSTQLDTQRKTLEDAYNKQISDLQTKQDEAQKKIDEFTAKEQDIIEGQMKPLTEPFREDLEKTERERLYINKNFEDNQKLTDELYSLLTEGNTLVQQMKGVTGLAVIRDPRVNKTISDVSARVGVIEAVMSARNGQIAQAYNMIDRSVAAITADRQDQLNYYTTLYNFYESQKDDEGKKLIALDADEKTYLDAQINLLQSDLANTQANADALKKAMTDPDTALAYAQAGITLNDTPAQVATKMANYAYTKEVTDTSNKMNLEGYSTTPIAGVTPVQTTDSKGTVKNWYKASALTSEFVGGFEILKDASGKVVSTRVMPTTTEVDENLLSAIMANPALINQLTPTVKTKVISQLEGMEFDTSKLLPSTFTGKRADAIAAFKTSMAMLDTIEASARKLLKAETGGEAWMQLGVESVGAWLKTNPDAMVYKDTIGTFRSLLTRAAGEKGVLTEKDVENIQKSLPGFGDPVNVWEEKLLNLRSLYGAILSGAEEAYGGGTSPGITNDNDPLGIR
jgi:hypothetical protein